MSELIIRKGLVEDAPQLAGIETVCFQTPWSHESIAKDIKENPMSLYIVAQLDNQLVGYVGIWNIGDEGHINNVAVRPEYRRQKIASVLLNTLIDVTEAAGVKSHTLEVRVSNEPAIELYKKFGFQESGVRPGYYEDGEDAMIMWRIGDPTQAGKES